MHNFTVINKASLVLTKKCGAATLRARRVQIDKNEVCARPGRSKYEVGAAQCLCMQAMHAEKHRCAPRRLPRAVRPRSLLATQQRSALSRRAGAGRCLARCRAVHASHARRKAPVRAQAASQSGAAERFAGNITKVSSEQAGGRRALSGAVQGCACKPCTQKSTSARPGAFPEQCGRGVCWQHNKGQL